MSDLPLVHECERMPNGVYLGYEGDSTPVWVLTIQKEATEADLLENHYLEEEGDIIWSTSLEVLHCPFCGEKLPNMEKVDLSDYGHCSHYDGCSW